MDINIIIITRWEELIMENELGAPASVEVKEQMKQPTTFTITYPDDICDGDFKMVEQALFDPFSELEIWVEIDGTRYCLVKGLVKGQQIKIVHGGQGSQLQVNGADNSIRLGWVTEKRNWGKKMDASDIWAAISSHQKSKGSLVVKAHSFDEYRIMGESFDKEGVKIKKPQSAVEEDELPPPTPEENQGNLEFRQEQLQSQDDLGFIRQLADQKGMHFWISYEEDKEVVNFEKLSLWQFDNNDLKSLNGNPDAITLYFNNGEHNDIEEFNISWDTDRPTSVKSIHLDRKTREPIISEVQQATQPKFGNVTLGDMTGYLREAFISPTVSDSKDQKDRNEAALNDAEWFIKANCSTSYDRLCKNEDIKNGKFGKIIHAHNMINILGAGSKHSGTYLVSGVTHSISPGSYKVQLELMRNSWIDIEKLNSTNIIEPAAE